MGNDSDSFRLRVAARISMSATFAPCRMPKDSKKMTLKVSLEEEAFCVYVARIPLQGEILKLTREAYGQRILYAYRVLDVDITCYLKAADRNEHVSLDARVTALLTDSGY